MERAWRDQTKANLPPLPPLKKFKPKMGLPILRNYRKKPLATFWTAWPKRTFEQALPSMSWVCGDKLKALALKYQYTNWARLERVCERLGPGATIGCMGRGGCRQWALMLIQLTPMGIESVML